MVLCSTGEGVQTSPRITSSIQRTPYLKQYIATYRAGATSGEFTGAPEREFNTENALFKNKRGRATAP
jgi:hypothetical protein